MCCWMILLQFEPWMLIEVKKMRILLHIFAIIALCAVVWVSSF